jgi:uncharacterized integral membrane protein
LLRVAALGSLVIAATQAYWAVHYAEAGFLLIAVGQVLVTLGGLMFTSAFARARPQVM